MFKNGKRLTLTAAIRKITDARRLTKKHKRRNTERQHSIEKYHTFNDEK